MTAPAYEPVITHLFTPDYPYLPEDAAFGVKRDLVAHFKHIRILFPALFPGFRLVGVELSRTKLHYFMALSQ